MADVRTDPDRGLAAVVVGGDAALRRRLDEADQGSRAEHGDVSVPNASAECEASVVIEKE